MVIPEEKHQFTGQIVSKQKNRSRVAGIKVKKFIRKMKNWRLF